MQFNLNQQSRLFYDEDVSKLHTIHSEKPMRYRMIDNTNISQNKYMEYPNSINSIDTSSDLRSRPTRLNEFMPSTPLYGTAPLKARNAGPIDVESELLHGGVGYFDVCRKPLIEEHLYFDNNIKLPVDTAPIMVEDTVRGGDSTRNMYKNTQILNR